MAGTWREQLAAKITEIDAAGGPPEHGAEIVIQLGEMPQSFMNSFLDLFNALNDVPFCGAKPGTLTVGAPGAWSNQTFLHFIYRPKAPQGFASSKGLMQPVAVGGSPQRVIMGMDFNELP